MQKRTSLKVLAAFTAMAFIAVGCGDDDDSAATGDDTDAELEEFCALATELDEQEEFPSTEQLQAYGAAAPAEIKDAATTVVDAFVAAGDDPFAAFEDPAVEEAFQEIEPFEEENCGIDHSDGEDEEEPDPAVQELDPAAARVDVIATDYAYEFAAPAAGRTSFVMANQGQERHVMLLFKTPEGQTTQQVLEAEGEGLEEEYESGTAAAGEEAVVTADLTPGDWAMICYIPDPEGTPHFELGMLEEFTVQ
jgi:uncharacterized cupredoxin-like copper-binding protein